MRRLIAHILFVCTTLLIIGCTNSPGGELSSPKRSVYYWRTTFALDSLERSFIKEHDVERIYLHLFDVVRSNGELLPNATTEFSEPVPENTEIVPVVFLNVDIMNDSTGISKLPGLIVKRVNQMMDKNQSLKGKQSVTGIVWKEMQIDFDWTGRNQKMYYHLLEEVRQLLKAQNRQLSVTIRLHQLAMTPPPADYGALMVYNIGNYADPKEQNSILNIENLKPYLRYLKDYKLPLTTALPIYSWNLAFHDGQFTAIVRNANISDTTLFQKMQGNEYMVTRYHISATNNVSINSQIRLYPGDIVRHEECSPEVLTETINLIRKQRSNALQQIILYHLDNENINKYNYEDIENIYRAH